MKEVLENYLSDEQLSLLIEIDNDGNFFGMPRSFGEGSSYLKGKIIDDGIVYASSSSYQEGYFEQYTPYVYYEKFNICNIQGINFSTEKKHVTFMGKKDKKDYDQCSLNSKIIYNLLEKHDELINDIKYEKEKEEILKKYYLDDFELEIKTKTR